MKHLPLAIHDAVKALECYTTACGATTRCRLLMSDARLGHADEEMQTRVEAMVEAKEETLLGVDLAERRSTFLERHTPDHTRRGARLLAVRHARVSGRR